jgi:hypothetical protein
VKVGREGSSKETTHNETSIELKNNEPLVKLFIRESFELPFLGS